MSTDPTTTTEPAVVDISTSVPTIGNSLVGGCVQCGAPARRTTQSGAAACGAWPNCDGGRTDSTTAEATSLDQPGTTGGGWCKRTDVHAPHRFQPQPIVLPDHFGWCYGRKTAVSTPAPPSGQVHHITEATLAALDPILADRARKLAAERQRLAHDGTGYVPAWDELTADEQAQEIVEASHWLRAFARIDPPAGAVLGSQAADARGQIAAIIGMSDDGTDMLDEIMAGPVAALVAVQRGRERLSGPSHSDAIADTGDGYTLFGPGWHICCLWCTWEAERPTKGAAVAAYQEHERRAIDGDRGSR